MSLTTAQIWEACSAELRAFIARRASEPADADDILQETFIKIHNNLERLRDEERLTPWVYQITRTTIADFYRRQRPLASLPPEESGAGRIAAGGNENANGVEEEVITWLRPMVENLPAKYRQALELAEFEGISQVELAERLSLSHSGAKSRVQRGRAMLRQQLLDCCQFDFDRRGAIIDYRPHPDSPGPDTGEEDCC